MALIYREEHISKLKKENQDLDEKIRLLKAEIGASLGFEHLAFTFCSTCLLIENHQVG